jgi:hypothetical protein
MKAAIIYGFMLSISGMIMATYSHFRQRYITERKGMWEFFVLFSFCLFITGVLFWKVIVGGHESSFLDAFFTGLLSSFSSYFLCWLIVVSLSAGFKLLHFLTALGFSFFGLIKGGWFVVLWSIAVVFIINIVCS